MEKTNEGQGNWIWLDSSPNKQAATHNNNRGWIWLILVLLAIVIWGVVGEQRAESIGTDCNFGIGDYLCWFWEENVIGEVGDEIEDAVDDAGDGDSNNGLYG